jgi:VWFA-related protein
VRLTLAFVIVSGAAVLAQEPSIPTAETPLYRSAASDLVVLSATVTDRDGGFVEGLAADRFLVYDNGTRRPIQFFSSEDTPVSVGLVIDNSSSMRGKIGEVVAAAVAFARASHPEDELFALAFNDTVHEVLQGRRFLLASDIASLEAAVASLRPEGQTSLYDAVIAGLDRLEEGSRSRKVLIVLSDGADNASRSTLDQAIERARRSEAAIYTLGLFDRDDPDRNPGVLQDLARATGGQRFLPESAGPLMRACQQIALDIRSAYTIAFEPPQLDGKYHRVQVELDRSVGRRVDVRTRPGYIARERPQP